MADPCDEPCIDYGCGCAPLPSKLTATIGDESFEIDLVDPGYTPADSPFVVAAPPAE